MWTKRQFSDLKDLVDYYRYDAEKISETDAKDLADVIEIISRYERVEKIVREYFNGREELRSMTEGDYVMDEAVKNAMRVKSFKKIINFVWED